MHRRHQHQDHQRCKMHLRLLERHGVAFIEFNQGSYRVEVVPFKNERENTRSKDSRAFWVALRRTLLVPDMRGIPQKGILKRPLG